MESDFMTFYRSLTVNNRVFEEGIVEKSIAEGIIPDEIGYAMAGGVCHGVIKGSNGELYYFNHSTDGSIKLVKAKDDLKKVELSNMLSSYTLGCKLAKAGDGQGSAPSYGGQGTINEDIDIDQQDDLLTDKHPASAITTTPDRVDRGRMWHEQEVPVMAKSANATVLLDSISTMVRKSTSSLKAPVSDKERSFLIEVMGKTPSQVDKGDTYMSPAHKVLFQQWLGKSMQESVSILDKWVSKK